MLRTKILRNNSKNIKFVSGLLLNGDIVGIPTETVYGLGANAFNFEAVEKIFLAKNRPQDNPLIVHIHKLYDLNNLVSEISPLAEKLIQNLRLDQ